MARARTVAEVIAGEAVSGTEEQRIADMRAIASVIANRAALLGVTPEQVVANTREFNAYNRSLPPGVGQQIIDMAQEQIDYVAENGPVNNATFYATPSAVDNLPNGLSYEDATTGHQYFSDPQNRAIGTSQGYVQPNRYAYAQNLDVAGIPTPYGPDALGGGLLTAFQENEDYQSPFDAVLSPSAPAVNPWSEMAAAKPVQAPMDSVTASGLLGATPALTANATANPMMSLAADGLLGTNPGLSANATVSGLPEVASVSSRMGIAEPGFDQSRFDGNTVSVATDFDQGRFATPSTAFDQSRFGPSIDVATNTQSFIDQPTTAPATGVLSHEFQSLVANTDRQLANPSLLAPMVTPQLDVAATGLLSGNAPLAAQATVPSIQTPTSGLLSNMPAYQSFDPAPGVFSAYDGPRMMAAVQEEAKQNFANAMAAPMFNQTTINSIPAMATPANPTALDPMVAINAQPSTTFNPASLVAPVDMARAVEHAMTATPQDQGLLSGAANPNLMSPSSLITANPSIQAAPTNNVLSTSSPMRQNGFLTEFTDYIANNTFEPATINGVVADPNMPGMTAADDIATVDGPATTPAVEQQQDQQATATEQATTSTAPARSLTSPQIAAKSTLGQKITNAINPGTIGGGLLGGIAAGPVGGLLGGLIGNGIYSGSAQGLLGGGFSAPTTNIGGGIANIAGLYGGAFAPGSFAVANNGATITAQPGGWSTYTNKYGVTEAIGPDGKIAGYFGSGVPDDPEASSNSGGFLGGLFG